MLGESRPMNRIRPLKRLLTSWDPDLGSLPNHSSSSVREEVIEWSVSSANFRFIGVFHTPFCEDGTSGRGGVGTRGRGVAIIGFVGTGGAYSRGVWSFNYN